MKSTSIDNKIKTFLTFNHKGNNNKDTYLFLAQVIVSNVLFILFMIYLFPLFQLDNNIPFYIYIPGIIMNVLLFSLVNRKRTIMIGVYLLLFASIFIIFHSYIINGLYINLNHLFELIGRNTGTMISPFQVDIATDSYHLAVLSMFIYIGLLLSFIAYFIVNHSLAIILWFIIAFLFILQYMLHLEFMIIVNLALVLAGIYITVQSIYKKTNMLGSSKTSVFGTIFFIAIFIFSLVSIVFLTFKPFNEDESAFATTTLIQNKVNQQINDFRYEKARTNTFTEGDFTNLDKLELQDEVALEVIMEKPTSVYLRGFTGAVYTSEKWLHLAPEDQYDSYNLFYWLNEDNFHPLNQLSLVNELTEDEHLLSKTTMTINNVKANSKYLYTPYELITNVEEFEKVDSSSNQTITSSKFFGDRLYQFESYENLVTHYPTLANELYDTLKTDEEIAYKNNERHYNEFVYDTYTDIPKEVEILLEQHMEVEEATESHIAYEKAINYIRDYLSTNVSYNLNPEKLPKDTDFSLHVLEDSKEGYATHYATVATLMFRHVNIPARYVEGYLVTPKDIQEKDPYEKIHINGTNAHAWTEIYIDQIGWIPVETTPPYYNTMEQTDVSNYPKGNNHADAESEAKEKTDETSETKKVKDEEEKEVINKQEEDIETNWNKYIKYISIGLIILLLLAAIGYVVKKRLDLHKIKKSLHDTNANIATKRMFSYSLFLLHYDGIEERGSSLYTYEADISNTYGQDYAEKFTQAITLNQIAIYSNQNITANEQIMMEEFMEDTIEHVIQSKSLLQRLKMKYWGFIY